jgi:hypothetical protein
MSHEKKSEKLKKYSLIILKLFETILKLNQEQQKKLLKYAEELTVHNLRTSVRKGCYIPVSYAANRRINVDPIINISKNGLFIETQLPLSVGQEILMSFSMQGYDHPIKIKGEIVRTSRLGIGVEYKEASPYITEMIDTLIKRIED